ncbi:fibronectin type III domain protein [Ancylostoma caninum]|uniref:Fibronectin type III domain protein n=1 Tax=Ancylostoma caninum TaxID=29170 RepID=A0A368G8R8_ANCCA|nr:fibronectin type III domain protein [Ancylostoma caninum]
MYRLRATVLINQVESSPSKLILVNTKQAAAKSPAIQSVNVLVNGSAIFQFIPAEDADVVTLQNYTLEYREVSSPDPTWTGFEFESDSSNEVLLTGLLPNRTYEARLFANGNVVHGHRSRTVPFHTNNTAQLPEISLDPEEEIVLDPDVTLPLEVNCHVVSSPPSNIHWLVDGQPIQAEHSFYTVTNSPVDDKKTTSSIHIKSRTRNDNLTCVAANPAGQVSSSVAVRIRGPGSPPSAVTLQSERGGYTVSWAPPTHPNGNITKYVVYHSSNKEDPLSDWQKLVLDGTENTVRILSEAEDAFYVRVQAAADSGPGVISDIVAIEKDTVPISVSLHYEDPPDQEHLLIEPGEKINVRCSARGKPRPQLLYVIVEENDDPEAEEDVWTILDTTIENDNVVGDVEFTTLSSKVLHCKAKNTAGSNSSSLTFVVRKPGDAPHDVQVLSIDARDVVIVWKAPKFPNMNIESYELLLNEDVSEDAEYWQKYLTTTRDNSVPMTRLSLPTEQLKPSYQYYVRVRAINQAGAGPLSEPIEFTTPNGGESHLCIEASISFKMNLGPENPPSQVSVDINEANIAVMRWNKPNCTTEILNYVIYFTRDLGISNEDYREWQTVEVPATETQFKFDHQVGLKPKTFYRVRVSAKNDVAEGPVSETKEFETAHSELPIPTDIRTSVAEDNTLTITFSAVRDPDDHSSAIQRYKIELAQSDDVLNANWHPVNASSSSIDDMTSQANFAPLLSRSNLGQVVLSSLGLRTRAEIEGGPVIEKEPNLFETLQLVCRAEGSPVPEVTWYWNDDPIESEKEGWTVQQEQSERVTVSTLARSSVRESGLALCVASNEDSNATAQVEVRVLGPGSAPRDVRAVGWRNQINVTWQEPLIANGAIMVRVNDIVEFARYLVSEPGDVPTNITWSFDENDSLFIDWSRIQYPNGNVTYILYLSNFVDRVAGPPVRIPQVPYNVNVTLQISAENEWGEGEKSDPITFLTPHGGPRNAPSLTSLLSKDMKVTMSWLPPTQPNGEIKAGKRIWKQLKNHEAENQPWQYVQVNANRTNFTIDESVGLEEDSHYKMKISATNERHEGPASEISWFDTYINIGEDLPAPENVTAYLRNTSLVVHIPLKHTYQNYVIYVRPEYSEQYWKYEAINVTDTQETLVIQHFPLDKNDNYRMKISGLKHGRESRSSQEFALTVEPEPNETSATTESDAAEANKANAAEKRRIVKEPPL